MTQIINEPSTICESFENSSNREHRTLPSPLLDVIEPLSMADTTDSPADQSYFDKNNALSKTNENEKPLVTARTTQLLCNNTVLAMPLPALGMIPISGISLAPNKSTLPAYEYISPSNHTLSIADFPLMELNRVGVFPGFLHRRSRGEKRPIPEEQKDEKYYERRKRNNEAAKKSRDARKIREDRIAFRAALLEQENSILRAQILALRDELQAMRRLIASGTTTASLSMLGANNTDIRAL